MNVNRVLLIVFLMGIMMITGCWNRRELSELSIVSAIGIDKLQDDEYLISFQIINPSEVAGKSPSGGAGGYSLPVNVYRGMGKTIREATLKASQQLPRKIYFSHVRLVVIGETLAQEGIQELFDFFERFFESRLNINVLVARNGDAESVISFLSPIEKVPGNSVVDQIKLTTYVWSSNVNTEMVDVIKMIVSEGKELSISGIKILGNPKIGGQQTNFRTSEPRAILAISGIAIFKDMKLVKWLDGDEAYGTVWTLNKMKSTMVSLDCQNKKNALDIVVLRSKTRVQAKVKGEKPSIYIDIKEESDVGEVRCGLDLSDPDEIMNIEKALAEKTKRMVLAAVKEAQKAKSDIFGFGEYVNMENPKTWKQLKDDWNTTFVEVPVNVTVTAYIRRTGLVTKPYFYKE
ncbi:Ger(x)C family spore germination protein [Paenibacillus radicis (ex Xue et al. 2023)]|uniref:Ger(X)C family spore germination protein n=1 Tax=Paenibacillus radicis (ex Xue et al. 2023) TaxID=2972489 RepID=A0ABT1YNG9_9BACL|nr:Ger(x)C family spore germination protein [Paenibacillus radicis (ex Xue et al. 2023)]MCR8634711.1 Ger(x)C family spore germination protein [Paenibacillus radicis (ex Xue et al. 2023)]